ncbi:hypothetical protein AX16_009008 [Volvariella volvacea WC 439]|nr:hypothetical protein AX16_009008 [Volvariella volvacea WC 439]
MPHATCAAVAAAQQRTGLTDAQIAEKVGTTEAHITDIITGKTKPTAEEFQKLAVALEIKDPLPHDAAHSTA